MDRRKFLRQGCIFCVGATTLPMMLESCQATHYVDGTSAPNGLEVATAEFTFVKKGKTEMRQYIIVQNDKLEFPIYLYRISENEYSALWMKCSHQGAELQAVGDHLQCPSHGSEFTNKGIVNHGPAEKNLRSFPTSLLGDRIMIDLRLS